MKLNLFALMHKEFDGTGIIFDPQNNQAMALNKVGVVIWEALEKSLPKPEIVNAVVAKFDVTPEIAAKDIENFLETLKSKGLLAD